MYLKLTAYLIACFLIACGTTTFAQDENTETQAGDTDVAETQESGDSDMPQDFDGLLAKWNELDAKMNEISTLFEAANDVESQTQYRTEFQTVVDDANVVLEDLRDAGMEELAKDPANKTVLKTLMGIAMNAAENGDDETAMMVCQKMIDGGLDVRYLEYAAKADRLSVAAREIFEELMIRQREAEDNTLPRVKITTNRGEIVVELFENEAPGAVGNFISLAEKGFYDGHKFHRVIQEFMAQTGDPDANGKGGPGYKIYCECDSPEARRHFTGSLAMAHSGPNTGGSQFYITFTRNENVQALDGKHTVFGRVISGLDALQEITKTHDMFTNMAMEGVTPDVMEKVEVIRKREHEYAPNKVAEQEDEDEAPKVQPDETGSGEEAGDKDEEAGDNDNG